MIVPVVSFSKLCFDETIGLKKSLKWVLSTIWNYNCLYLKNSNPTQGKTDR